MCACEPELSRSVHGEEGLLPQVTQLLPGATVLGTFGTCDHPMIGRPGLRLTLRSNVRTKAAPCAWHSPGSPRGLAKPRGVFFRSYLSEGEKNKTALKICI